LSRHGGAIRACLGLLFLGSRDRVTVEVRSFDGIPNLIT
jgi:hypothetical protein